MNSLFNERRKLHFMMTLRMNWVNRGLASGGIELVQGYKGTRAGPEPQTSVLPVQLPAVANFILTSRWDLCLMSAVGPGMEPSRAQDLPLLPSLRSTWRKHSSPVCPSWLGHPGHSTQERWCPPQGYSCACVLSCIWLFVSPWTVTHQALLSIEFSRQEYWSGLPCPPPGDLSDPGIEQASPASSTLSGRFLLPLSHLGSYSE